MGKGKETAGLMAASALGALAGSALGKAPRGAREPAEPKALGPGPDIIDVELIEISGADADARARRALEPASPDEDHEENPAALADPAVNEDDDAAPPPDVALPAPADSNAVPDADEITAALERGREEGRRATIRSLAGTVSAMAVGAMITLLVLSVGGQLGPTSGLPSRTVVTPPPGEGAESAEASAGRAPLITPPAPGDGGDDSAGAVQDVPEALPAANMQVADPTNVSIPAIGVDADIIPLQVLGGELQVPSDYAQTGWWQNGPEPGEVGPSVIVGHVDSTQGPAVFFDLRSLRFDDRIIVTREDGSTAIFAVRASSYVDKDTFPSDLVYGDTDGAELRLITCDGDFADGSYLGNLIVFAEQVGETAPPSAATGI